MEIKFNKFKYKNISYTMDLRIDSGVVNSVFGEDIELFVKNLREQKINFSKIFNKSFNNKNIKILYVDLDSANFKKYTVKSEINYYCKLNKITNKSFKQVINEYIECFGFDNSFINKKINQLSISEKKKFYMFLKLLFEYDFVILKNIYKYFDLYNINIINNVIKKIRDNNKFILLIDDDINNIYNISDYIIYLQGKESYKKIEVNDLHSYIEELLKNNFKIPDLLLLTYFAKTDKKIKLTYLKDVRDVIKDIYKHV